LMVKKLVVGVTGMPGAGKTAVIVDVARDMGYGVVVMGDVVRSEAERWGLAPTPENIGRIMLELRRLEGEAAIAKKCVSEIYARTQPKIVVDGIRSLAEVEEFKKNFKDFVLVAVHSSPETRFMRLYRRSRSDDPRDWEVFHERDMREIGVGIGGAIAMAEYMLVNEGSLEEAKREARQILERIERKWTK